MDKFTMFCIGIGLTVAAVAFMLWLAPPSRSCRAFKTQRLRVEVSDPEGDDLDSHEVIEALEEALKKARRQVIPEHPITQTAPHT